MKVLLVANYAGDRQWSMERFCKMLQRGLQEEGVEVEVIRPGVTVGGRNKWLGYLDKYTLFRSKLQQAVKKRDGWLVHILDQGNGVYAGWVPGCMVTCHDLIAIRAAGGEFPGHRPGWSGKALQRQILGGLRKAKAIACVSGATQRDVTRLIGPSEVIANGLEESWQPVDEMRARTQIGKAGLREGGYLLHVGGAQWYKNRAQVVRTFIEVRNGTSYSPRLVLVGPPLDSASRARLKSAGLKRMVHVLTGVSDETLRALYSMAGALVFPSIAEGFGWPILEAQACGCPVMTTNAPAIRETSGGAAIHVEEGNWTRALRDLLAMEETQRAALVAAGMKNARRFSVKRMAREYVEFYRRHAL